MLTWEEDVEAAALRAQGWTIQAIARHLGRDPKTIRAYLAGERVPGRRRSSAPDGFAPFVDYVSARLGEDRHVWATALHDEVRALGYRGSYPSFPRALRTRGLRPHCEACAGVTGRETVEIAHPPGEETQWDWVELPGAPWGGSAHVLVGALSYSSQARAVLAETEDLPHLVEALDGVARRFGGTTRRWRVDRMATAIDPHTGRLQPGFAAVAKHYRVGVDPCPPRRANRKGVVEKAIHFLTQRWWRTARLQAATQAQASLDRFCAITGDARPRPGGRTVGELAETEPLRPLPIDPFPATIEVTRKVTATCLVAFRGNHYSVPPGLVGQTVQCATGWAASTWRSARAPGWCWPATDSRPPARAAPSGWPATPPPSSRWCWPRSPPTRRARASPTGHRARRRFAPPASSPCWVAAVARSPSTWTATPSSPRSSHEHTHTDHDLAGDRLHLLATAKPPALPAPGRRRRGAARRA